MFFEIDWLTTSLTLLLEAALIFRPLELQVQKTIKSLESLIAEISILKKRFQALSDASFEAIFFSDQGVCLDQNRAAERMFGFSNEEAMGKHGTEWILPEHRDIVQDIIMSGQENPVRVTALKKDGSTFPAEIMGSETVLLVDDKNMVLEVGKALLSELGYKVVLAEGGHQALDAIQRMGDGIDLGVLDLIMPGMNGEKTYDLIKELKPQIPVMLSSGYSLEGKAAKIMNKGCNGFIQKPFNIAELSKNIRKIFNETTISA